MIQARNLDWSAFGMVCDSSATEIPLNRVEKILNSLTIEKPGKYAIFAYAQSGEGDNLFLVRLLKNGTEIASQQGHGSYIQHTSLFEVRDCDKDDVVTTTGYTNNAASTKRSHGIIALRIG